MTDELQKLKEFFMTGEVAFLYNTSEEHEKIKGILYILFNLKKQKEFLEYDPSYKKMAYSYSNIISSYLENHNFIYVFESIEEFLLCSCPKKIHLTNSIAIVKGENIEISGLKFSKQDILTLAKKL